jgi:hypothetical protein
MNLPVSAFPDPPKSMMESFEPKGGQNPLDEEYGRQVGNDEIVSQDNARIQVVGHKSSFWGVDNSWK